MSNLWYDQYEIEQAVGQILNLIVAKFGTSFDELEDGEMILVAGDLETHTPRLTIHTSRGYIEVEARLAVSKRGVIPALHVEVFGKNLERIYPSDGPAKFMKEVKQLEIIEARLKKMSARIQIQPDSVTVVIQLNGLGHTFRAPTLEEATGYAWAQWQKIYQ